MHPAKSVIFFTVISGLGLGLFAVGGLSWVFGAWSPTSHEASTWLVAAGVALVAGLASSSFHLANPKNAWRSWMRFRTSWLSREAILAVLVLLVAALLWLICFNGSGSAFLAGLLGVLSLLTLYATGMIYACLKTIRQWHTPLTPVYYVLAGCSSGALAFYAITGQGCGLACVLVLAAAAVKLAYYIQIGRPAGLDLRNATGLGNSVMGVKLLETGHSGSTFLTREFGGQMPAVQVLKLRIAVFVFSLLLPMLAVAMGSPIEGVVLILMGHAVERWLFFTEAKHVVRLYHGQDS